MIIDIHAHDGKFAHSEPIPGVTAAYDYLGETMPDFIADLDRDQVSHCFISSATALLVDMIEGNVVTFRDAGLDPRLFAYVYYDPMRVEESLLEAEKYRHHPKFIGFKTRPEFHKITFDHPSYRPLLEIAAQLRKPILLHCTPIEDAQAISRLAPQFDAAIIMVHACLGLYKEAVTLVKDCPNVYIEPVTSFHFPGKIRTILNIVGHERLMFGTDYGLMARQRIMRTYDEANLSPTEQAAIFGGNARRVFGIL
jgi:uncharacterized protein